MAYMRFSAYASPLETSRLRMSHIKMSHVHLSEAMLRESRPVRFDSSSTQDPLTFVSTNMAMKIDQVFAITLTNIRQ